MGLFRPSNEMRKKRLVLLTLNYPFGESEPFLETELAYLSRDFSVEIVPCMPGLNLSTRRRVPEGVTVREEIVHHIPRSLIRKAGRLFSRPIDIMVLLRGESQEMGLHWSRFRGFMGFAAHAVLVFEFLKKLNKTNKIDCIYSYWLSIPMAWKACRKYMPRIPIIARAHGVDLYTERVPDHYLLGQRQIIENVDRIFCVSEHGADYLKEKYPGRKTRIEVSRLGVPDCPEGSAPSGDGKLHIVSCSYPVPVKRVSLIVEALSQSGIPVTWTHLGGGGLEDALKDLASRLLSGSVQWTITGAMPHREILRFYRENPVDIFINVSSSEGLPVSIMEAMSCGIPVAATDAGGTRELVKHGKNGYLWPVDISPEMIMSTLESFYRMPEETRQAMRTAARDTWRKMVCAENQYQEFVRSLQGVCGEGAVASGAVSA